MTHSFRTFSVILLISVGFVSHAQSQGNGKARTSAPAPTLADVVYRDGHPQNVFDLWLADSKEPSPLVIYIHGGGYSGGSKTIPSQQIRKFLSAGISVAAVEYRFVQHAKLPAAHHDCRRALQFLRSKAGEWNLNPERVGAWGGSAGAQLCMYLAFHDDMADPESADPVERESTRLHCVSTNGGQATMDLELFKKWIPGYDTPHRGTEIYFGDLSPEALKATLADLSAITLLSEDDPPLYMNYRMRPTDPVPDGPEARGWQIHHVVFGIKLKEKMDTLGIESHLIHPGAKSDTFDSFEDFLISKLKS